MAEDWISVGNSAIAEDDDWISLPPVVREPARAGFPPRAGQNEEERGYVAPSAPIGPPAAPELSNVHPSQSVASDPNKTLTLSTLPEFFQHYQRYLDESPDQGIARDIIYGMANIAKKAMTEPTHAYDPTTGAVHVSPELQRAGAEGGLAGAFPIERFPLVGAKAAPKVIPSEVSTLADQTSPDWVNVAPDPIPPLQRTPEGDEIYANTMGAEQAPNPTISEPAPKPIDPYSVLEGPKWEAQRAGQDTDIFTVIRKMGGLRDEGGDLTAMGLDKVQGIIKPNGVGLDDARAALIEQGYLQGDLPNMPPTSSIQDVKDLLGKRLSEGAEAKPVQAQARLDAIREDQLNQAASSVEAKVQADYPDFTLKPYERERAIELDREGLDADSIVERLGQEGPDLETRARLTQGGELASSPEGFAGNVNLKNIYTTADAQEAIKQVAAHNENFTTARRGVMSQDETRELAGWVGMDAEKLAKRQKGGAFNAEEMFAARTLLVKQSEIVGDMARKAHGGADIDKAAFAEELTRLVAIQEHVSGATAEAGRALQQFRMMAGASKEQVMRMVEAAREGGLDDAIARIAALEDPQAVAGYSAKLFSRKASGILKELWYNSVLSGPKTHVTNVLSNGLVALLDVPEALLASAISKVTGSGITARGALSRASSVTQGAREGLVAGAKAFKTEEPSIGYSKLENTAIGGGSQQAIPGRVGKALRTPSRALLAEDEFFKAVAYRQEINARAWDKAWAEGKRGQDLINRVAELKNTPTDEMTAAGRHHAEMQTFTNPLGKAGKFLMGWRNSIPGAWMLFPFVRTPVNLVKGAMNRTPAGLAFQETRDVLFGRKGARARDEAIARMGVGSTIVLSAIGMALEGGLTGGGPKDPAMRGTKYTTGWQPYSFKIGDTYASFSRIEPIASLMGIAADFVEIGKAMSDWEKNDVVGLMIASVSRNLASKTWLSSVTDAVEAYNDPERYGANYLRRQAGAVVPNVIGQAAQAYDPYLREARSMLDEVKSKVPGLREGLPIKRDSFGRPIKREGSLGPDILSPIYTSTDKKDPVANELVRLNLPIRRPSKEIAGVELKATEYDKLQELSGGYIKIALSRTMTDARYNRLDDEDKRDILTKMMIKPRAAGRIQTVRFYDELRQRLLAEKQAKALRMQGVRNALVPAQ